MKRIMNLLLLALLCQSFLYAAGQETAITERLDKELTPIIQQDMSRFNLPALSIAVVCDGRIIWSKGFGYADRQKQIPASPETVYRVGSISKLFNATGLMLMRQEQRLSLDEDIGKYLPEANFVNPFDDKTAKITLRHILSHRAGTIRECPLGHYFDDSEPSPKDTAFSLFGTTLIYPPGAKAKYSNSAIGVSGYILEKTVGMEYSDFQKDFILKPLGMNSSSFVKEESFKEKLAKGYMRNLDGDQWEAPDFRFGYISAANLYSSATDMAKFIAFMCNQGKPLLKPESFSEMTTVQFEPNDVTKGFGLGFYVSQLHDDRTLGHGGAVYGFSASILAVPERKLGAISLINLDGAGGINKKYIDRALSIALEEMTGQRLLNVPSTTELPPSRLHEVAGRYQSGEAVVWLTVKKGKLYYQPPGGTRKQLAALSEDEFITDDYSGYGQEISIVRQKEEVAGIKVDDTFYTRTQKEGFPWQNLVGQYGPDYNITQVYEKDGKLTVLVEWFYEYPLKYIEGLRFAFPSGLYHGEELTFIESEGSIQALEFSGAVFKRRH